MKFRKPDGHFDVDRFAAACRIFFIAQEILVDHASYPTARIARNSHMYRPLGLGYSNLGSLLMADGLAYDSDAGRGVCGAITAILHGAANRASAELAAAVGAFEGYSANREPMLRVMQMHRKAVDQIDVACPQYLRDAARHIWDEVLSGGQESSWYEIDAKNAVVGRLATVISKIIRGKNKTTYTPHMDHGDFVVVKNIEQAKFTGKKFQNKKYYRHTGHPGGIKETTPEKLHEKKPGETLKLAVKRMLPGGVLGRKQLTKLKIYSGSEHPHAAQNPTVIELNKLNNKNVIRN